MNTRTDNLTSVGSSPVETLPVESSAVTRHIPVLLEPVLEYFAPLHEVNRPYVFDGTLGGGGHAEAILRRFPNVFLVGTDQDSRAIDRVQRRLAAFRDRTAFFHNNFSEIDNIAPELSNIFQGAPQFHAILVDLGLSSDQLDDPSRGFSFHGESLDMRMNPESVITGESVLNSYSDIELRNVFLRGGVRSGATSLARAVIARRPIRTATTFRNICDEVFAVAKARKRSLHGKSGAHSATVPFQALRIEVNDELVHIDRFLASVPDYLAEGGRLAAISFHSAEDERVTRAMRKWGRGEIFQRGLSGRPAFGKILTPKPVVESDEIVAVNPRARSARLRVFERAVGQPALGAQTLKPNSRAKANTRPKTTKGKGKGQGKLSRKGGRQ